MWSCGREVLLSIGRDHNRVPAGRKMLPEQAGAAHALGGSSGRLAWVVLALCAGFVALGAILLTLNFSTTGGSSYFLNNVVAALALSTPGALIASRRRENPIGWLFLAAGFLYAVVVFVVEYSAYALVTRPDSLPGGVFAAWLSSWVWLPAGLLVLFLLLYFPDGRLPSSRWRPFALLVALGIGLDTLFYALRPGPLGSIGPTVENPFGVESVARSLELANTVSAPLSGSLVLVPVAALVVRFRRATGEERQQFKWVAYAAAVLTAAFVVVSLWPDLDPSLVGRALFLVGFTAVPAAVGIAILKYRLYDIDLIINRTLVYGALTTIVVGLYALVVGGIGTLLQARGNLLVSLLGVGLVAVLFAPLKEWLQRGVNHLLYGERDEPYSVVSRLGARVRATDTPEAVLPAIVETVAEALKLPHAAIKLRQEDGGFVTAAAHGAPLGKPLVLPLSYGTEVVGQLVLSPRAPGEPFDPADRRLLDGVAHHAEAAVYAARLTSDLQRSRERLVTAREEERRRLRRDLHDGLGPQLATVTLNLDAARNLLDQEPESADALLAGLKAQVQDAISDIRRLVYDLRPPALDELGLIQAIREGAVGYARAGLDVRIEAPQKLPPLPAAVEVAAYRIAQEGLTNAARHARASVCRVRLYPGENGLELEVADDGVGLPEDRHDGVGIASMRERAAELGGTCRVTTAPGGGTRIFARLPLSNPEDSS
jgi:two-component system NarL family sensor kinase